MNLNDLISAWTGNDFDTPPYYYKDDKGYIPSKYVVEFSNFRDFVQNIDNEHNNRNVFHMGLFPLPYMGELRKAKIFLMMANPGFAPADYKAEEGGNFKEALLQNLKQEFKPDNKFPLFSLNPANAWHGGYTYWTEKLADVIEKMMFEWGKSYSDILKFLANNIAVLELNPYHSKNAVQIGTLPSSTLISSFVHDYLVPLANRGEIQIIITRRVEQWGVAETDNILTYNATEARAAFLSANSRGGKKIIHYFLENRTKCNFDF